MANPNGGSKCKIFLDLNKTHIPEVLKSLISKLGCFPFSDTVDTNIILSFLAFKAGNKNRTILVSTCVTKCKAPLVVFTVLFHQFFMATSHQLFLRLFFKVFTVKSCCW